MWTSALFGPKTSNFSKFMVCPHGQGGGGWASADIFRTTGVNFSRFCADIF